MVVVAKLKDGKGREAFSFQAFKITCDYQCRDNRGNFRLDEVI